MAQEFGSRIDRWEDTRKTLAANLAAADRIAVARQVATDRAPVASLGRQAVQDRALAAALGKRTHQLSLTPVGPIRIPIRTW